MLQILSFILFITYVYIVFTIKNFSLIFIAFLINIILLISCKLSIRKAVFNILHLMPFIIFTAILNLLFSNLREMFLIAFKLIIVCNITFIYKNYMGTSSIIETIEKILSPFKFIEISSNDISLIINIAFTSIPIFLKEIKDIQNSLISKGIKKYSIFYIKSLSKLILLSLFKKTNDFELSLKSKGVTE